MNRVPAAVLGPFAAEYADGLGMPPPSREELERRLEAMPAAKRWAAAGGAALVRWAFPTLLLGRAASFSMLSSDDRERLLVRLQGSGPLLRACLLAPKSAILAALLGSGLDI